MKKTQYLFILLTAIFQLGFVITMQAQSPVTGITYTYDAAGNRVHRSPATSSERKAALGAEEKKETVVVKNNIVASFTPNPTTTGNFAVVVSSKNLSANENNATKEKSAYADASADKPIIFIYNPLGELIHQESAQYNSQVNISLSGLAKGIYIIKIQSGEDVLMHRMAYQ